MYSISFPHALYDITDASPDIPAIIATSIAEPERFCITYIVKSAVGSASANDRKAREIVRLRSSLCSLKSFRLPMENLLLGSEGLSSGLFSFISMIFDIIPKNAAM